MKPILCKICRLEIAKTDGEDLEIDGLLVRIDGLNPFIFGFKCLHRTVRNKKEVACGTQHVWMRRCGSLRARVFKGNAKVLEMF
jgi:hypothetical protein